MKLIIAGGRKTFLSRYDKEKLSAIHKEEAITEVISGGASGVDNDAICWAEDNDIPFRIFRANWRELMKAAGPIRNKEMAEYADAVALFPGGTGTKSMFKEAKAADIKIYNYSNIK
tara:strand:- start:977 stop:1324 length:348 start_codon:yes stop_codon:yes gene_type:complete